MVGRRLEERGAADARILGRGDFVEDVWREEGEIHRGVTARGWEEILEEIGRQRELEPRAILGNSKMKRVSPARRAFLVRAHAEAGMSAAKLGRIGNMAYSSVQEALAKGLPEGG